MRVVLELGKVVIGAFAALSILGCGRIAGLDDYSVGDGCRAGEVMHPEGRCTQVPSCAPNEIPTFDGCEKVGVSSCGDGFTEDPGDGCRPILPTAPCSGPEFAYPGVRECGLYQCGSPPNPYGFEVYYVGDYGTETPNGTAPYASIAERRRPFPLGEERAPSCDSRYE